MATPPKRHHSGDVADDLAISLSDFDEDDEYDHATDSSADALLPFPPRPEWIAGAIRNLKDWTQLFWDANPKLPQWIAFHRDIFRAEVGFGSFAFMCIDRYDSRWQVRSRLLAVGEDQCGLELYIKDRASQFKFSTDLSIWGEDVPTPAVVGEWEGLPEQRVVTLNMLLEEKITYTDEIAAAEEQERSLSEPISPAFLESITINFPWQDDGYTTAVATDRTDNVDIGSVELESDGKSSSIPILADLRRARFDCAPAREKPTIGVSRPFL